MINLILLVTCVTAILDWLAVWQEWRKVGYVAKPLTIILLFTSLVMQTRLEGPAFWFGIGLLFSLAGDIFLMISPRYFLAGIASFSLVHLAYLAGFLSPLPTGGYPEILIAALVVSLGGIYLMRRITYPLSKRGESKLMRWTWLYGMLISLMLLSAMWTLFRSDWAFRESVLVSLGALLFYSSDLINAWIRFVNPFRWGRVAVMISYHVGQILIITGMMLNWFPDLMV